MPAKAGIQFLSAPVPEFPGPRIESGVTASASLTEFEVPQFSTLRTITLLNSAVVQPSPFSIDKRIKISEYACGCALFRVGINQEISSFC
jgi:hypothetical protein